MKNKIYEVLEGMLNSIGLDIEDIILVVLALLILLIIMLIVVAIKQTLLSKKYKIFMKGSDGRSLEEEIRSRIEQMENLDNRIVQIEDKNVKITRRLNNSFQKMGIVKYDAFKEMGGQLSFALALLSDQNTGFVINVMHSREGCYNYVKEIVNGKSTVALAEEEKTALDEAIFGNSKK